MMITAADEGFDQALLRQAFGCFPSGVTAFCGMIDGKPEGMTASSFTSVSIDPALVSVCVANSSSTWPKLASLPALGLSVLSSEHGTVARSLALRRAHLRSITLPDRPRWASDRQPLSDQ